MENDFCVFAMENIPSCSKWYSGLGGSKTFRTELKLEKTDDCVYFIKYLTTLIGFVYKLLRVYCKYFETLYVHAVVAIQSG